MEEITFKIILPLAFIAMTILALHFWTLYLKYKKMYLEYKVKENEIKKDIFDSIIKGYSAKDENGKTIADIYTPLETYREETPNSITLKNKSICSFCGKTEREQMKGCNEITCYRQHL
jgi:hypothetical protein